MERIQKLIAASTQHSRRAAEELIKEGKVSINNKRAELGEKASESDIISINGKAIDTSKYQEDEVKVLLMNKQSGVVCSKKDNKHRPLIFDYLPATSKWFMVGRLDINTSGLILFTNSGDLAHALMHPSSNIDREYLVRVLGEVTPKHIQTLKSGVQLEDGKASFKKIEFTGGEGSNSWYKVVLNEGRNREVRRMWEHLGFQVSRLMRIRFGELTLPKALKANEYYELKPKQVNNLMQLMHRT